MTSTTEAPKAHTVTLTRGALYQLERVVQEAPEGANPEKRLKWAKMWSFIRKSNTRQITLPSESGPVDFEKGIVPKKDEAQDSIQRRVTEHNEAFANWSNESVTLDLSDKRRDIAREAVKVASEKNKLTTQVNSCFDSNHTEVLLEALGFGGDE